MTELKSEISSVIYTEFSNVEDGDYTVAKLVTGETLIGVLNKEGGTIDDVALILPAKPEEGEEKQQMSFYTIPYGMPLIDTIKGENVSLQFVIKCFPVSPMMEDLVKHYEKIKEGKLTKKPALNEE